MSQTDLQPNRKSYEQVCPISTALDFVGDRWTILILRELLGAPARFQELRNGLPGIAPNLLTERLRRLQADGIVRRVDAGGSGIYALTEDGAGIRTAIVELGFWASRLGRAGPATHGRSIRALAVALQAALAHNADEPTERFVIELEVDGEYLEIVLDPQPSVKALLSPEADARLRMSTPDASALLAGASIEELTFTHISGNKDAMNYLIAAFGGQEPSARPEDEPDVA